MQQPGFAGRWWMPPSGGFPLFRKDGGQIPDAAMEGIRNEEKLWPDDFLRGAPHWRDLHFTRLCGDEEDSRSGAGPDECLDDRAVCERPNFRRSSECEPTGNRTGYRDLR